jgi:hypothetical protein
MDIDWGEEKNEILKTRYGFGFQRAVDAVSEGAIIKVRDHPDGLRYGHQKQFLLWIDDYVWVVPFVETSQGVFLKTMFPSRKATKRFRGTRK